MQIKKAILLLPCMILFSFVPAGSLAQDYNEPDSLIITIISQVSLDSLINYVNILSGEDSVVLGDSTYLILSRHTDHAGNDIAADFIENTLLKFGLATYNQQYSTTGRNVYAIQEGELFPEQIYIICAHYDAMPADPPAPGADDDASGVATVLECARILSQIEFPYTIIYALWDEEEQWMLGSQYFADQAAVSGTNILGVINCEMFGWDSNDDGKIDIHTDDYQYSVALAELIGNLNSTYQIGLEPVYYYPGADADHTMFWRNNYSATVISQAYWGGDFNNYYHTADDKISHFNLDFFLSCARLAITTVSYLATFNLPEAGDSTATQVDKYYKNTRSVKVYDNIIYRIYRDSLEILDFSVPSAPVLLGKIDTLYINDFVVKDDFLYTTGEGGFNIIDIQNPSTPEITGRLEGFCGEHLAVSDDYVYSVSNTGMWGCRSIIDISDRSAPLLLLHTRGGGNCIKINSDILFIDNHLYDLSRPDTFQEIGFIQTAQPVKNLQISDDKAYFAEGISGLQVYDISDPANSFRLGSFNELGAFLDIALNGNLIFAADGASGVRVIDITSPVNPKSIGSFKSLGYVMRVAADDKNIYVINISNELYTITNPIIQFRAAENKGNRLSSYYLYQNYPNPFNPLTTIEFTLAGSEFAVLKIYNILGQNVETLVSEKKAAGHYRIEWDASLLASGVYYYQLVAGDYREVKKMLLVK